MKHKDDKGKFYLGVLLVVAPALWIMFLGFQLIYMAVLLVGLLIMLFSNYKVIQK